MKKLLFFIMALLIMPFSVYCNNQLINEKAKIIYDKIETERTKKISNWEKNAICKKVCDASKKYNIDIYAIYTIIEVESSVKYDAISRYGRSSGYGLMQVSEVARLEYNNWHKIKVSKKDIENISINIEVGCWYMSHIRDFNLKSFKNLTYSDLYVAYNVGPTYYLNKSNRNKLYQGQYCRNGKYEPYNALTRYRKLEKKYKTYFLS